MQKLRYKKSPQAHNHRHERHHKHTHTHTVGPNMGTKHSSLPTTPAVSNGTQQYTRFVQPANKEELVVQNVFDQTYASFADNHFTPVLQHHAEQRQRPACDRKPNDASHSTSARACRCLFKCEVTVDAPAGYLEEQKRYQEIQQYVQGPRTYVMHLPLPVNTAFEDKPANEKPEQKGENSAGPIEAMPVVILLHGTDETAFDTEWMLQAEGEMTWLDLSHAERFAVLFPQARGAVTTDGRWKSNWRDPNDDPLRTMWLISCFDQAEADHHFLATMLSDACVQAKQRGHVLDLRRVFLAGYSNGGFMAGDVLLRRVAPGVSTALSASTLPTSSVSVDDRKAPEEPATSHNDTSHNDTSTSPKQFRFPYSSTDNFPLAGLCMFMGAVDEAQLTAATGLTEKNLDISPALEVCLTLHNNKGGGEVLPPEVEYVQTHDGVRQHRVEFLPAASTNGNNPHVVLPSLIYTGTRDPQMLSSIRAFRAMSALNQPTELRLVNGGAHEVKPGAVREIWEFFRNQLPFNKLPKAVES